MAVRSLRLAAIPGSASLLATASPPLHANCRRPRRQAPQAARALVRRGGASASRKARGADHQRRRARRELRCGSASLPAPSSLPPALRRVFESLSSKYRCRVSLEITVRSSESADCHNRITVQPLARSARSIRLSRRLLQRIFSLQYLTFDRGRRNFLGLPCQKSPSVKTTTFACGKTKSGQPGNLEFRRHPAIPCLRMIAMSFSWAHPHGRKG